MYIIKFCQLASLFRQVKETFFSVIHIKPTVRVTVNCISYYWYKARSSLGKSTLMTLINITNTCILAINISYNSPLPSSGLPLSQNEYPCKTFHMKTSLICMKMDVQAKHIFIRILSQLRPLLKQRQTRTRQLAIVWNQLIIPWPRWSVIKVR